MATLLEIQTRVYENLLLGKQLPLPKTNHPQAECGRNIEQLIEKYLDADKKENNIDYPTFSNGVDIQSPYTGDWEVKSRQIGGQSYLNIGAITTSELDACIKYDIPFEDTDFSRYACKHIWCWYNDKYKIVRVEVWDMSLHTDAYRRAYYQLTNTIKAGPEEPLQTTPNLNKFFNLTPEVIKPKGTEYFNVARGMCWELNGSSTSWHLRVNENKLNKMGKITGIAKQFNKAVELA